MDVKTVEILEETLSNTLETMAFMFADRVEKGALEYSLEQLVCAEIEFSGKANGTLRIIAPFSTCCILSANMLGMEVEDDECSDKAYDAFKEALNVICGQFLTTAYGELEVFRLSTPRIAECTDIMVRESLDDEGSVGFLVEEKVFIVQLLYNISAGEAK